jgi:hypothetical protein
MQLYPEEFELVAYFVEGLIEGRFARSCAEVADRAG